jgi:hypothetical protein
MSINRELPAALREEVAPLLVLLQSLNEQIKQADEKPARLAQGDEMVPPPPPNLTMRRASQSSPTRERTEG